LWVPPCDEAASPALAAVLRDDFVAAYERELRRTKIIRTPSASGRSCS